MNQLCSIKNLNINVMEGYKQIHYNGGMPLTQEVFESRLHNFIRANWNIKHKVYLLFFGSQRFMSRFIKVDHVGDEARIKFRNAVLYLNK